MNICIFDTETTSLEKPYCYNIGYVIYNLENRQILKEKDFVIEQIWHNLPLFNTSYYAEKRPIYINRLRARQITMEKIGYITQKMIRDFDNFNVFGAYAYNSSFDERVFNFNCDWFKIINPFEKVPIFDIKGYAHNFIVNNLEYEKFCEENELFTDAGNYSSTAETVYKFITNDNNFVEEHTALSDSRIETEILQYCFDKGAEVNEIYKSKISIARQIPTPFKIFVDNEILYDGDYIKKYVRKNLFKFTT